VEILVVIMVSVGLVATGLVIGLVRGASKQRAEAIRQTAERLGWGYREEVPLDAVPDLKRYELFRRGSSRKLSHLMTSPVGDPRAVVFVYTYTVSNGKSTSTYRQTVFYATRDHLTLPSFSLRPERFYHRVGTLFGYQDINLDAHPEFSRMFPLRGEDEAAVRAAFSNRVAEFFERHGGTCATGGGREILYWRPGKRIPPAELRAFIAEGSELAERFSVPTPSM
jgi:hypothetical protein